MPDCAVLSRRAQIARLRRLAGRALQAYPLRDPRLVFVAHGENTTFRVDDGERYLLRVHRPNRHGRDVDSTEAVRSELWWLAALRAETAIAVPEPVPTRDGELTTMAADPGVAEPRVCSMLRWMDGRIHAGSARPEHLRRLGAVMAGLHNHADAWTPPPGFVRIRWDWAAFFGDTMEYGGMNAAKVWDLIPGDLRPQFDLVAARMEAVMAGLGHGPDAFGLIHADLHLENALFTRDEVRLIDFDDCGYGHRVYDLAVALWELRHDPGYPEFREALLAGYTAHRPLPHAQLDHLDAFIMAREVAFGLWFAGTARVNPAFAADLDDVLDAVRNALRTLLDQPGAG